MSSTLMRAPGHVRRDHVLLAILCASAVAIELHYSQRWHFGFDESWHVSIAAVEPFSQFAKELRSEAHPPLSYVLLRWLTPLHGAETWPRLLGMLASAATVVLAYRCALEMALSPAIALIGALVFAVSSPAITMAVVVRAYGLATTATLAAYLCFLRVLRDPRAARRRERLGFVVAALLAMWTEYSAILVVLACVVPVALAARRRPGFLRALWRGDDLRLAWTEPGVLLAGMVALARWIAHSDGSGMTGHLTDYLLAPAEPLGGFAWRGFTATLDHFVPVQGVPFATVTLFVVVLGCLSASYLARARGETAELRGSVLLILVTAWAAIFILATQGLYPYGGKMRHQYVLFPFLVFVLLFVVDEAQRRLRRPIARALLCGAVAAGVVATSARALPRPPNEEFVATSPWGSEIQQVLREREPDDVIYAPYIDTIALFTHLRDYRWTRQQWRAGADLFVLEKPGSPPLRIVRDTATWWFPMQCDATCTARVADVLRAHAIGRAWVLALRLERQPLSRERARDAPLRSLFREHDVALERRLVFESGEVFRVTTRGADASAR